MDTEQTTDDHGHFPGTRPLACAYCGGELYVETEYEGPAYLQERVVTGITCETCSAEWEKNGTPRRGPHSATVYVDQITMI